MSKIYKEAVKQLNEVDRKDINSVKRIARKYRKDIYEFTENINSKASYLSRLNIYIKGKFNKSISESVIKILKPTKKEKTEQIKERKEINMGLLENRKVIDYKKLTEAVEELKKSEDYYEISAVISIVSGRRITEICKTGEFKKVNDTFVEFSGQLKKKDKIEEPYNIPILFITTDDFINIFNKIRGMKNYKKSANRTVSNTVSNKINMILKKYICDDIVSEQIRGAYAYIAYRLHSSEKISEILYGSKILGHNQGDLQTFAQNYNKIVVDNIDYGDNMRNITRKLDRILEILNIMKSKIE